MRWAASPTTSTCPARIRSASIERNSYTVLRVSGPSSGAVPRLEQRPDSAGVLEIRRLFVRQQHELPAPMAWPALDERGRADRIAPLTGDRKVRQGIHVVWLGVNHQPALLEAEIPAGDPARLRTTSSLRPRRPPTGRDRARLPGRRKPARLDLCDTPDASAPRRRRSRPAPAPVQPRSHADASPGAGDAVERLLERRLEEHVIRLPSGARQTRNAEAQQELPVGPEPLVVADRDELLA